MRKMKNLQIASKDADINYLCFCWSSLRYSRKVKLRSYEWKKAHTFCILSKLFSIHVSSCEHLKKTVLYCCKTVCLVIRFAVPLHIGRSLWRGGHLERYGRG